MRITIDKLCLILLIASCFLNGAFGELLFWAMLVYLIYRNRHDVKENENMKAIVLIILGYIVLMGIQYYVAYPDINYRLVGLTKCVLGIPLCVLLRNRVCKHDIAGVFIKYMIPINFAEGILYTYPQVNEVVKRVLTIPGINTIYCLNLILLPHVFWMKNTRASKALYALSLIFVSRYNSSTYVVGLIFFFLVYLKRNIKFKLIIKRFNRKTVNFLVSVGIIVVVVLAAVSGKLRNMYLTLLTYLDYSRYFLANLGIDNWLNLSKFNQILGTGDNRVITQYGELVECHNFIIEVLTVYGVCGIILLTIETFVFLRESFMHGRDVENLSVIMYSVLMGYMFYMLHPYYTTGFLSKIFIVLLNYNAYCRMREQQDEEMEKAGALDDG